MRTLIFLAPVAALFLVLGAGLPAGAQTNPPTQIAQNVSGPEANRRGDEAYDRKDYAEAMRWYRLSAQQNYPTGQANIGFLYAKGFGVPQNWDEAVYWYRQAAENGQREAQHNLALRYQNGEGVAKDMAKARYWMQKSAAQGDSDAQKWLQDHP